MSIKAYYFYNISTIKQRGLYLSEIQAIFSFLCSGGRIRTSDLWVMSPTSYHCSTPQFRCKVNICKPNNKFVAIFLSHGNSFAYFYEIVALLFISHSWQSAVKVFTANCQLQLPYFRPTFCHKKELELLLSGNQTKNYATGI